jgi:hypothetical protein
MEWRAGSLHFLKEELRNPNTVGVDIYYSLRNVFYFYRMQTRHQFLPMTIMHYKIFIQCRNLQNERYMKLSLATKFSSVLRKKNLPVQELHTMTFKTWSSGLGTCTIKSRMNGTIYKACAKMTCPLVCKVKSTTFTIIPIWMRARFTT